MTEFEGVVNDNVSSFPHNNLIEWININEENSTFSAISFELSGSFLLQKPIIVKNIPKINKETDIKENEVFFKPTPFLFFVKTVKEKYANVIDKIISDRTSNEQKYKNSWAFIKTFEDIEKTKDKTTFKKFWALLEKDYPWICNSIEISWDSFYNQETPFLSSNLNWIEHKCLSVINLLLVNNFLIMLPNKEETWEEINKVKEKLYALQRNDFNEMLRLFDFLTKTKLLTNYRKKMLLLFNTIEKMRNKFLPIYLSYYQNVNFYENVPFVLTLGIYEILNLYANSYEILLEISNLFVFIDNIKREGRFDVFKSERYSVIEDEIFYSSNNKRPVPKGEKLKSFFNNDLDDSYISFLLKGVFDSNIRNAINHGDYIYDHKTQVFDYKISSITLYELSKMITKIIRSMLLINETLWFFKKMEIPQRMITLALKKKKR